MWPALRPRLDDLYIKLGAVGPHSKGNLEIKKADKKGLGYGESNPELPRLQCSRLRGGNVSRYTISDCERRLPVIFTVANPQVTRQVKVYLLLSTVDVPTLLYMGDA